MQSKKSPPTDAYNIGWVCVNDVEWRAAKVLLDEIYSKPHPPEDNSPYFGGRMGRHKVVFGMALGQGKSAATKTAANMIRSFRKIRFVLIVGIAGGATTAPPVPGVSAKPIDIFLGDVVVSAPAKTHGGILQYDQGKLILGDYEIESHLNKPPPVLEEVIKGLQMDFDEEMENMLAHIEKGLRKWQLDPKTKPFMFPGPACDRLFDSDYEHPKKNEEQSSCAGCAEDRVIQRSRENARTPGIHYGLIASGDTLVRDAKFRDKMRSTYGALCFEMETAGLAKSFPCLAIRGISDYADSHKNDTWQPYAALTAAAYAKELLNTLQTESVFGADIAFESMEKMKTFWGNLERVDERSRIQEYDKIFDSLSSLNFNKKQDALMKSCVPTCGWLTAMSEFEHWVNEGPQWQLRLYGEAGVGKTYFCAQIIDYLRKRFSDPSSSTSLPSHVRPVIFVYLSDDKQAWDRQTPRNILGSLVQQLIKSRPDKTIPDKIQQADPGLSDDGFEGLLKKVFEELLEEFQHTYLIVDGLYQCTREALEIVKYYPLELIRRDEKSFRLSLLTTSPGYRQVNKIINCDGWGERDLEAFYTCECNDKDFDLCHRCMAKGVRCPGNHKGIERYDTVRVKVGGHKREDDIVKFCRQRLDRESTAGARVEDERHHVPAHISSYVGRFLSKDDLDDELQVGTEASEKGKYTSDEKKQAVAQRITRNAQGNFLIANAWLDDLIAMKREPKRLHDLLLEVDCLSKGTLVDIFNAKAEPLKHCKSKFDQKLASRAISFTMAAFRPLSILALQHALSLSDRKSVVPDYFAHRTSIIRAANGLLCIDRADPSNSFVRLFHPCLCVLAGHEGELALLDKMPHLEMAHLCLDYLEHSDFREYSKDHRLYPFLSYALEHWGDHVREAKNSELDKKLLRLLKSKSMVKKIAKGAGALNSRMPSLWIDEGVDAIRLCAWYNLSSVIQEWDLMGYAIKVFDDGPNPATICYACVNGNLEAVEELLDKEPTTSSLRIRSAAVRSTIEGLHTSERFYDREMRRIKILAAILCNENLTLNSAIDYEGSTVLIHAVKEEYYNFATVLLKTEPSIDVEIRDDHGRSALCYARGPSLVSLNRADRKAHKDIIEMLVCHPSASHKAMINMQDQSDSTA